MSYCSLTKGFLPRKFADCVFVLINIVLINSVHFADCVFVLINSVHFEDCVFVPINSVHFSDCVFVLINSVHFADCVFVLINNFKHKKIQTNAYLFLTRTHSMHIFGEIPFIKPQNDT